MPSATLNISNATLDELAESLGYTSEDGNKGAFVKAKIVEWGKVKILALRQQKAVDALDKDGIDLT